MSPERKSKYIRPLVSEIELFPVAVTEEIKSRGNQLVSPFWVLWKFGITFGTKSRDYALARLLQTNHGNEIRLSQTPKGPRIHAFDIDPLIDAMDELYPTLHIDFGPKEFKRKIEKIFH